MTSSSVTLESKQTFILENVLPHSLLEKYNKLPNEEKNKISESIAKFKKNNQKEAYLMEYFQSDLNETKNELGEDKIITVRMPGNYMKFREFCRKNKLEEKEILKGMINNFLDKNKALKVQIEY